MDPWLQKNPPKKPKQQKLFIVYYQLHWLVIFHRVDMLISETEFEECVQ